MKIKKEEIKFAFKTFNRSQILVYLYIPLYKLKSKKQIIFVMTKRNIFIRLIYWEKKFGIANSNLTDSVKTNEQMIIARSIKKSNKLFLFIKSIH